MTPIAATTSLQTSAHDVGQPPALSPRLRVGIAVASALITSVVLSSVVLGITAAPDLVGELAARPAAAAQG